MNTKKRGSGLFVVLIIATAIGIGAYSVLSLVNGEFYRNKKASVYNEAKQAAESLLQASMADLRYRFENQSAFPIDTLSPTKNPLYVNSEFLDIHKEDDSGSHLVIPTKTKYTDVSQFNTQPTEIIGGQIPPGRWQYIDPRIPGNQFDELAGTRVFERNIELISKATATRTEVGTSTVYARQFLQVRDAPLFAYAIFYNLPMEIAPGPKMDVYGNVHSNNDTWFQAGTGLDIHSKVTIAGAFNHGRHPDSGKSSSGGDVRIVNGSGNLVNMKEDGTWPSDPKDLFGGSWLTSDADNFYDIANQIWDGNVQTENHGVLEQNPVGVREYIEDTDLSTNRKESYNSAYNLIQPVLTKDQLEVPREADGIDAYQEAVALNEIEQQKYSYKAGLTITVDSSGGLSYSTYNRNSDGSLKYEADGSPKVNSLSPKTPIATYKPFNESGSTVTSGIHDKRQAEDVNIVEIDVRALKDLVHGNDKNDWGGRNIRKPDRWWNGVVYVDFPQEDTVSSRDDHVNPAKEGLGVKLTNGDVIPNPSFAHSNDTYGMSLATNQMLYVEGNYNADGDRNTGSPTKPDDPDNFSKEGHEAPAALIADSITFLSVNWQDDKSNKSMSERKADSTEVSAAILTGLVPSGEDGSKRYSGGVENFPRFLENWGGQSLRIRGSMVALFESEVATRGWGYGDVYRPPNRDWGFHSKFGEGYLPPGTPNTRRYRAIDFELVNQSKYEEYVERIKTYF